MTQTLPKYHSRTARYILQPQDNTFIRVAGPRQTPWEEGTEIQNISLSGLAFTAPMELCPVVGEFIKIQFEAPGQQQMACYGLVTRIEPHGKTEMVVGIQFHNLEMPQRLVLLQGLAQRLKTQQNNKIEKSSWPIFWSLARKNWKALAFIFILLSFWMALTQWVWNQL